MAHSDQPNDSSLLGMIRRAARQETVSRLMAGNDAGCFTTQQYLETYCRQDNTGMAAKVMNAGTAAGHLADMVRDGLLTEVRPGVWSSHS
jgi:hypothetical protein